MAAKKGRLMLSVAPGERPKVITLPRTLEALQEAVGGYIEAVYPFDDPVAIICNEEGKLSGLELNRALRDEDGDAYDIIAGTFLITGITDDDFDSLTPELLVKYAGLFATPEAFIRSHDGSRISIYPLPPDQRR